MSNIIYRVRQGFSFVIHEGEALVRKLEGEVIELEPAVGDGAHQLERADPVQADAEAEAVAKVQADAEAEAEAESEATAQTDAHDGAQGGLPIA
jgi:hypothetical protein